MEVGEGDLVVVHQSQCAHPRTGQVEGCRASQSAYAHDEYAGLLQSVLSLLSDFGQEGLSVISLGHGSRVDYGCVDEG